MELQKFIRNTFSQKAEVRDFSSSMLPFYLQSNYSFYTLRISDAQCVLIMPKEDMNFSKIKKHYEKICELCKENCALVFNKVSTYRRNKMIEDDIPFIVCDNQIYLPFFGIVLSEQKKKEASLPSSFVASTQLVMLYLYYKDWNVLNATELATATNLTRMTTSRAVKELVMCGLVKEIGVNTRKRIVQTLLKQEFLALAKKYLKSPVQRVIYIKDANTVKDKLIAGISALAEKTMIASNAHESSYAIDKKEFKLIAKEEIVSMAYTDVYRATKMEVWNYDPKLLASKNVVDDISLILTLDDIKDERTEKMLDEIKEAHQW